MTLTFDLALTPGMRIEYEVQVVNSTTFLIDISYSEDIFGRGKDKLTLEFKQFTPHLITGEFRKKEFELHTMSDEDS